MLLESRKCFGEERYEINEFQSLVYNNFKILFNLEVKENKKEDGCLVLNANETIECLQSKIFNFVHDMIKHNKFANETNLLW